MDWMEQEQERGITITSAATTCFWNFKTRNTASTSLTPRSRGLHGGGGAFTASWTARWTVLRRVGVEPQSETNWGLADKYNVPRIGFVNKMDRSGADFFNVVGMIKDMLVTPCAPQCPSELKRRSKAWSI